ncbi:MAG: CTP synthase [Candidatus Omnitrophica bacterium]|nr:CTP synthase [Candidatus Omnitrophota bacterium]
MPKYIFITGGVVSSLGKGVASASIGKLLEARGLKITLQKLDPYINVDAGTMNPYQHGEVYVTDDGAETDLDLGHYERFTSISTGRDNNVTTGKIYHAVIQKERQGDFLGSTVQVVPHITDEIKEAIRRVSRGKSLDVVICEVGGTVGDIEGLPFLEAIRQFRLEVGRGNAINIHLTLVPYIRAAGELKTKPTQHSVAALRQIGLQPEVLLCRTEKPLSRKLKEKIGLFCNISVDSVITAKDVKDIYEIPLLFQEEGLDDLIVRLLELKVEKTQDLKSWREEVVRPAAAPLHGPIKIAVVGKYIELQDAYKSIYEAIRHGGIANDCGVEIKKVESERIEKRGVEAFFKGVHGILVPGGFGGRGIKGKLKAIQYARENGIPFFGICLGMQCAVIEFARDVLGHKQANSTEFDPNTPHPVISLLAEQRKVKQLGGTMRLGAQTCQLKKKTLAHAAYRESRVSERHRHRYEFNSAYKDACAKAGMIISGYLPGKRLAEIIELVNHPWFVGCQFHPELKSKPDRCHPLFRSFIKAALIYSGRQQAKGDPAPASDSSGPKQAPVMTAV